MGKNFKNKGTAVNIGYKFNHFEKQIGSNGKP